MVQYINRDDDIKPNIADNGGLPIPIWSEHFPGEFRPETLQVLTLSPLKRLQKVSAQSENFYFPLISSRSNVQYRLGTRRNAGQIRHDISGTRALGGTLVGLT